MHRDSGRALRKTLVCFLGLTWLAFAKSVSAAVELDEQILAVPLDPANGSTNYPSNVSIALHPLDGRLHAVFASPSGSIYHAKQTAAGWDVSRLDSLGRSSAWPKVPMLKFDGSGVGHLAYVNPAYLPPPPANARGPQVLYRRLEAGVWTAAEATTPLQLIFSSGLRDLDMGVSADGSVVSIVASKGSDSAVAQIRTADGWGPRVTMTDRGQVSTDVTPSGEVILGLATEAGAGRVLDLSLGGALTTEQNLPGSHDLLRVLAQSSAGGDLHAAWITGTPTLNYWLHYPTFGWHAVPIPASVSQAALNPSSGNDFKFAMGTNSGLPWFLTSRGTGGKTDGALLAVSYVSGSQWWTVPLDQARGIDWHNSGFTLDAMLMASLALDPENRCHVVWQQLDTTGAGLQLRHVVLTPVPSANVGVDEMQPQASELRLVIPTVLRDGLLRVQLRSASGDIGVPARLEVIDATGRRIWREQVIIGSATSVVADLTSAPPGVYFVRAEVSNRSVSSRFSILR